MLTGTRPRVQVLETGEECDDGNNDDSDGCSSECATLACGDGVVHGSEECDDGNSASGDGCSAACTAEFCGDGIVNNGEDCDDGNTDDEDGCWTTCIAPRCGDGVRRSHVQLARGAALPCGWCSFYAMRVASMGVDRSCLPA